MNHYVYLMRSEKYHYVGVRSCNCPVEEDPYQGSGTLLNKMQKAGVQFEKTIICVCDSREEAEEMEAALVTEEEVADKSCLNLVTGGGSAGIPGAETRARQSAAKLGVKRKPFTAETIARMSVAQKAWTRTEAHKAKMRVARAGTTQSDATKTKISTSLKGIRRSEETRRRMSEAQKLRWSKQRAKEEETMNANTERTQSVQEN